MPNYKFKKSLAEHRPDLCSEWDCQRNGDKTPETVGYKSNQKAWWLCPVGHSWHAVISGRTGARLAGCPYCKRRKVSEINSIASQAPELIKEWDYKKNISNTPETVSVKTNKIYWWLCSKGHSYKARPNNRVSLGRGCPYCVGQKATPDTCLENLRPDLLVDWDYEKNTVATTEITTGSGRRIWWKCHECQLSWNTILTNRTKAGAGCPHCSAGFQVSKGATKWLDDLDITMREYVIRAAGKRYPVDGFDPSTNTVYEYLGDFWHGNPKVYDLNTINKKTGDRFSDLFQRTTTRIKELEVLGYKVVYIWESDFNREVRI